MEFQVIVYWLEGNWKCWDLQGPTKNFVLDKFGVNKILAASTLIGENLGLLESSELKELSHYSEKAFAKLTLYISHFCFFYLDKIYVPVSSLSLPCLDLDQGLLVPEVEERYKPFKRLHYLPPLTYPRQHKLPLSPLPRLHPPPPRRLRPLARHRRRTLRRLFQTRHREMELLLSPKKPIPNRPSPIILQRNRHHRRPLQCQRRPSMDPQPPHLNDKSRPAQHKKRLHLPCAPNRRQRLWRILKQQPHQRLPLQPHRTLQVHHSRRPP